MHVLPRCPRQYKNTKLPPEPVEDKRRKGAWTEAQTSKIRELYERIIGRSESDDESKLQKMFELADKKTDEVFSAIDEDECFSATETEYTNLDNVIVEIGDVLEQSEDVEDDESATENGLDKEGDYQLTDNEPLESKHYAPRKALALSDREIATQMSLLAGRE
jgi:hypothetical protein